MRIAKQHKQDFKTTQTNALFPAEGRVLTPKGNRPTPKGNRPTRYAAGPTRNNLHVARDIREFPAFHPGS